MSSRRDTAQGKESSSRGVTWWEVVVHRGMLAETFVHMQVGLRIYLTFQFYFSVKLFKPFLLLNRV